MKKQNEIQFKPYSMHPELILNKSEQETFKREIDNHLKS